MRSKDCRLLQVVDGMMLATDKRVGRTCALGGDTVKSKTHGIVCIQGKLVIEILVEEAARGTGNLLNGAVTFHGPNF